MYGARIRELICWITCRAWKPCRVAGTGTSGKKSGSGTTSLLLHETVEALRGQRIAESETVIEDTEAGAQDGFWALLRAAAGRPCKRDTGSKIAPVVDIRLCLVAEAEAEREVRPHPPLVAREDAHIHLVHRKFRRASIDGELRGASAERANHRRRIAELLEEQRPPVAFDRSDGRQLRLAVRAGNWPVLRIQDRRQRAAAKRESPVEVLRRNAVVRLRAEPHTEPPRVPAFQHRAVILQFVTILRVERAPQR